MHSSDSDVSNAPMIIGQYNTLPFPITSFILTAFYPGIISEPERPLKNIYYNVKIL